MRSSRARRSLWWRSAGATARCPRSRTACSSASRYSDSSPRRRSRASRSSRPSTRRSTTSRAWCSSSQLPTDPGWMRRLRSPRPRHRADARSAGGGRDRPGHGQPSRSQVVPRGWLASGIYFAGYERGFIARSHAIDSGDDSAAWRPDPGLSPALARDREARRMSGGLGSWTSVAKPFRYAVVITAAALLVGGWATLYVKARAVDLGAANEAMAGLRALKEIDGRWNDWLIGTRLGAGAEGAARRSSVEPTKLARIHADLAVRVFSLDNALPPATLARLKEAFDDKAKAVAAFGDASDAHRQALAGYLQAKDAFAAAARERALAIPPGVAREAERAHEALLAFLVRPDPAAARSVEGAIAQLAAAEVPEAARADVDRLAGALRKALDAKSAEDARFRDAFFAATGPRLDTAMRAFERGFGDALDEADRFRMYLLVYSALLLILAAWLAWRLTTSYRAISALNRQLREANEFLEHRVDERTKELKAALEQLKEQEALLIQSEKMSSLGQMVAGVAHEVNTPLAYVKASLDTVHGRMPRVAAALAEAERLIALLQSDGTDDAELSRQFAAASQALGAAHSGGAIPELDRLVKDGLHGIGQISELVNNLRNFARLDRSKIAEFDLNEGLAAALSIAKNQLKKRTVKKVLGAIPKVACAPSQINQVFLNLLTNAAQATPEEGGVITLRTLQPDPAHVAVEVTDNGHGIPPEVLPKIFDPFFTTKEVGKGTGLGLSICYKIVEAHGGRITADSKVGVGTKFTVTLPVKPVAIREELAA